MKSQEKRNEFVQLRAEGKSYTIISKELGISKSTCTSWERTLKKEIALLKQEQLNELYDSYYMTKEARIKKLGDTLGKINTALDQSDLNNIAPEKLLDYKLKYTEALKEEFIPTTSVHPLPENFNANDILSTLGDLLNRIRAGEVTVQQAGRESMVIGNLLKAYDAVELKTKIEALEAIVGGR